MAGGIPSLESIPGPHKHLKNTGSQDRMVNSPALTFYFSLRHTGRKYHMHLTREDVCFGIFLAPDLRAESLVKLTLPWSEND
jgi:hypothetical protein